MINKINYYKEIFTDKKNQIAINEYKNKFKNKSGTLFLLNILILKNKKIKKNVIVQINNEIFYEKETNVFNVNKIKE